MKQARVMGLAAWLVGVALLGCSSKESSGTGGAGGTALAAAGSAGASSSGGATGGAAGASPGGDASAGSGGALVLGDSKTEACMAYVLSVCARQASCSGGNSSCFALTQQCPDLAFSPGSTRTVAVLQACAEAYKTLPCDQIKVGKLPACVTPGTTALGQPCIFASQCSSLACGGSGACRACVPSAQQGEPCPEGTECAGSLRCTLGTCELPEVPTGTVIPPQKVGEPCAATGPFCSAELLCDALTSKCTSYPTLGMSCADTGSCIDSYCERDGLMCEAYPGEGMACGVDGFTGGAAYCDGALRCSRASKAVGTCVKLPKVGAPCLLDPETLQPEYLACDQTARCDATKSPPVCADKGVGTPCASDSECATGTTCICANGQGSCDVRVCGHIQLRNQPCVAPGDVCHAGFSCEAGVCQPRDSQGLFAAVCGP